MEVLEPSDCTSVGERPADLLGLLPPLCIERREMADLTLRIILSGDQP